MSLNAGQQQAQPQRASKTARAANALKSGVVYGGTALLSGVNAITPHFSGAVDIMVVEQPDKTYRSTPFYVRFGKYTHLRSKDRRVQIYVNGVLAPFNMHLGEYGQAYFASDGPDNAEGRVDDDEERELAGMMSPASGYSSNDEDRPPYASQQDVQSVEEQVRRLAASQNPSIRSNGVRASRASSAAAVLAGTSPRGIPGGSYPATHTDSVLGSSVTSQTLGTSPLPPQPNGAMGPPQAAWLQPAYSSPPTASLPLPPQALGAGPQHRSGRDASQFSRHTATPVTDGNSPTNSTATATGGASERLTHCGPSESVCSSALGSSPVPATHALGGPYPAFQRTSSISSGMSLRGASPTGGSTPKGVSPGKPIPGLEGLLQHPPSNGSPHRLAPGSPNRPNRLTLQVLGFPDNLSTDSLPAHNIEPNHINHPEPQDIITTEPLLNSDPNPASPPLEPGGIPVPSITTKQSVSLPHGSGSPHITHATSLLSQSIRGGSEANHTQQHPVAVNVNGTHASITTLLPPTAELSHLHTRLTILPNQPNQQQPSTAASTTMNAPFAQAALQALSATERVSADGGTGTVTPEPRISYASASQLSVFYSITPELAQVLSPTSAALRDSFVAQETDVQSRLLGPGPGGEECQPAATAQPADVARPVPPLQLDDKQQENVVDMAYRSQSLHLPPSNLLGPISPSLQGLELSLCGDQLVPGTRYHEALEAFDACRVRPEDWAEKGHELIQSSRLVVRLQGELYPWTVAAPVVLGWAAFGAWWPHLLPPDAQRWTPPSGMTPQVSGALPALTPAQAEEAKKGWRLWPFNRKDKDVSIRGTPSASVSELPRVSAPTPAPTPTPTPTPTDSSPYLRRSYTNMSQHSKQSLARKTLSPSWEQLGQLRLKTGQNTIKYVVGSSELVAYIYFYHYTTRLVISDIDGTITKSDVLGHLLPAMGWDWSHAGISRLFTDIAKNCYQLMYLSSRSISQAGITRDYLNTLVQGEHRMPVGPVIISPHGLLPSLYREMILRRPHEFKIATLRDIRALFPGDCNPFYAGFGNRDTDEISYREVGVPLGRIFIINPKGELRKAAVTMQSSTLSTLNAINQLIDEIFPTLTTTLPTTAIIPTEPPEPPSTLSNITTDAIPRSASPTSGDEANGSIPTTSQQSASGSSPKAAAGQVSVLAARGSSPVLPNPASGVSVMTSQRLLLTALQESAAEQFNDLQFWADDPSMLMAGGDVDELERFMARGTSPVRSAGGAGGMESGTDAGQGAKDGDDGAKGTEGEQEVAGDGEGGEALDVEGGQEGRSRDFIASFNPFAY